MKVLAIGVSGGPASGINAAIRSVVNHGLHFGYEVVGLHDAFSRLTRQVPGAFETLTPQRIEGISELPGSILGRSKPGIPTADRDFDLILEGFRERGVHDLIWIGGDDSSRILSRLIKHARGHNYELRVALIPKTIDNDVYLTPPERAFTESTLGFASAVLAGTRSVSGFLADATMSNKWWLWVAMGRSAGHLALGIYKRTEAEAFVLGEELEEGSSPDIVVDLLLGTMLKKAAKKGGDGRYGVAIISENIIEKLKLPELSLTRSDMGNLNLAEFDLAAFLAAELRKKCASIGFKVSIDSHAMGRDNRTAMPAPTDVSLGFAMGAEAVRALRSGANELVVSVRNDMPHSFPFVNLTDPDTGEPRTRRVSMEVVGHVVERCLWRVHPSDLADERLMAAMSGSTDGVTADALAAMLAPAAKQFGSPTYFLERAAMNIRKALRPFLKPNKTAADRSGRTAPRILIASASVGMGHVSAGKNLEAEFAQGGRPLEVRHLDILEYFSPASQLAYRDAYFRLVADHAPVVRILYDITDQPFPKPLARILLHPHNGHRFCQEVEDFDPDLVIATHFTPAMLISRMVRKQQLQTRLATVVTDFDVHGLWLQNQLDMFFVSSEESRQYLLALGVKPEQVCASGIPTNPVYGEVHSREACAAQLGIDPNRQTVLISAGGLGIGNLLPLIPILNRVQLPIQVLVMCGKSAELKGQVDGAIQQLSPGQVAFKTFGFTTQMDRFMSCCDLIFGKPGGLTTWESFRKGLAWAIHNPIPGQEERNMLRILEAGAGISCQNPFTIPYKLECLLGDPERLRRMRECSAKLARPDAAKVITEQSLQLLA